jgi:hypothetical protein
MHCPNRKAKYEHAFDTQNIMYLMNDLLGFDVNIELSLVQLGYQW